MGSYVSHGGDVRGSLRGKVVFEQREGGNIGGKFGGGVARWEGQLDVMGSGW